MALPPAWRRLSPAEKADARRLYLRSIRGGQNRESVRELYELLRGKSRGEVLDILTHVGNEYANLRVRELAGAARDSQRMAQSAARDVLSSRTGLRGDLGARAADWIARQVESGLDSYRVSPIEGPQSSRLFPEGQVWLSRNLHRTNTQGVVDGLRKALIESARHGQAASALAQRLRDEIGHRVLITDHGPPSFKIPEQLRAIEREAYAAIKATGDPRAAQRFEAVRREFEQYASKLGTGQKGLAAPRWTRFGRSRRPWRATTSGPWTTRSSGGSGIGNRNTSG